MAVALYIVGVSMRTIGKLFMVNASTVLDWVRNFAIENYEKPTPKGSVVIELDEMLLFLHSKKTDSGYGRLIVVLQATSLSGFADWALMFGASFLYYELEKTDPELSALQREA